MNLFLKIMFFVGFGIFTIESNGAEGDSDNFLSLRLLRRISIRDNMPIMLVNKQKLAFHLANELDDVLRVYNISSPLVSVSDSVSGHFHFNDELFFTIETKKGFVFSNIRCTIRRDKWKRIILSNCESDEAEIARTIALAFSWVEHSNRGKTRVY